MFSGTTRFRLHEQLGRGTIGVVYRASDLETGTEVALKTLRFWDPTDLYLLKREFRGLADIGHPNLVQLYELFTAAEYCFFTMELVRGTTFVEHLRAGRFDRARFAAAVTQLVHALETVHAAGKLHRDVKPSNVLVTSQGRVVVLDFGLATAFRGAEAGDTTTGLIAGTPAYMAPEQARGAPPAPAADWYAAGVMLYEALLGSLPFAGPFAASLAAKSEGPPTWPGDRPEVPARVVSLVRALLDPDPARRPGSAAILDALEVDSRPPTTRSLAHGRESDDEVYVDREHELAKLAATLAQSRDRPAAALVTGPSGIGKTSVVRRFLEHVAEPAGALALSGRCHPQETVPYRGFDAIVDQLSRFLLQLPEGEAGRLAPRYASALTRVFPVLGRVPALGESGEIDAAAEPHEVRRRGFLALRELLARIADRRPLALWIDDAQWGGDDGAALLRELLRPPDAPRALVLLSFREEGSDQPPLLAACTRDDLARIDVAVGPLDPASACTLVRAVAAATLDVEAFAAEAGGSPFLISQLARMDTARPAFRLRDVLDDRVRHLSPDARAILEIVSVAASPTDRGVVLEAAGCGETGRPLVTALQRDKFLRTVGVDQSAIETYHDRVREAVTALLDAATLTSHHRALARAFEARGVTEPDRLAAHLFAGGEPEQASVWAAVAADRAAGALAFVHAAALYRRAREWWPGGRERERDLEVREAEALVNAGRCAEAAALFVRASESSAGEAALDLRRRAAEQYLAGGHVDEGGRVLEPLLNDLGLPFPRTPRSAILRAVARLLQLWVLGTGFRRRSEGEVSRRELVGVGVCYSAAKSFSIIDPARSVYFSLVTLVLALRAGEPTRVARSLLMVGGSLHSLGSGALARWGQRLMRQAADLAGDDNVYLEGFTAAVLGSVHVVRGEWQRALDRADHGVRLLSDRCRGVSFDIAIGRMAALRALEELGRLGEARTRAEEMLAAARETGDRYAEVTASLYAAFAALAADRPDGARALVHAALAHWTHAGFHIQHLYALRIDVYCDLYERRPDRAWSRVRATWPTLERSLILRVPVSRVDAYLLRARSALATGEAAHVDVCEADAARLAREDRADAVAHAGLLRAGVVALRGDETAAGRLLAQAAAAYRNADMLLHAYCAEHRGAELLGAASEIGAIDERVRECGVRNPARWVEMYAPGFRTTATGG